MNKPIIICGVTNIDGTPAKRTKEENDAFVKMMSDNGKYDVIYDETNTIPNIMNSLIKTIPQTN
jgi:hypothetical protein